MGISKEPVIGELGVVGDVHGEDGHLAVALGFLARMRPDCLACTGDVVDGAGDVNACCHLLESAGVYTVRGNHERWSFTGTFRDLACATYPSELDPRGLRFLSLLPATIEFQTVSGRVLLCHGIGGNDMATVTPEETDDDLEANRDLQCLAREGRFTCCLCGHSHIRMVRRYSQLTIINAGALLPGRACFCHVSFVEGAARFYEIGTNGEVTEVSRTELH